MKITKEEIKSLEPCESGWEWYLRNFPENENNIIDIFRRLIDHSRYGDMRWFLKNCWKISLKTRVLLAVYSAELALPIYEQQYPNDSRIRECIAATKKFLASQISKDELIQKRNAAAAAAAYAAYAAAADAAYAAAAAADAADDAADDAAAAAYADAAYAAAAAADAAYDAADDAATWTKIIDHLEILLKGV